MSHKKHHETYKAAQDYTDQTGETQADPSLSDILGGDELEYSLPNIPENLNELCFEHVCPTCPQQEEAKQSHLRSLAEMENFKKRLRREHEEQLTYAAEKVLADLLPTLDNLDLALQYGSKHEACKDMLMGVEMTRKLLLDAVKLHGLEAVGSQGEAFNPEWHEGLSFEERQDMEEGLVSTLLQHGYKLKGRLLRPAKVCISKKPS